jgi:hypothetical protein
MSFDAPTAAAETIIPQSYLNNRACWRSYVGDLIYAAATSAASYAREIRKRKPHASERLASQNGQDMGDALRDQFPGLDCLALARRASGDDVSGKAARRQFAATVARCRMWLPPEPSDGRDLATEDRARRSGVTESQRLGNATELAASL